MTVKWGWRVRLMGQGLPWGPGLSVRATIPGSVSDSASSRKASQFERFPLFSGLSAAEGNEIISAAQTAEYARRDTLYLEGDLVRTVILLTTGAVKCVQFGREGTEVILRLNGPGELVGMMASCPRARHGSRAQALSNSTALVWDAAVFDGFAQRFPALRGNAARLLCRQMEELEERFRLVSTGRVSARLSHQLIRLLDQIGRDVDGCLEISLSREELAQTIGTTLFTVSRLLSDWDQRGIVSARREAVSILNLPALVELSESE